MRYLLDTNAVIALLKGNQYFLERLKQYQPKDFAISSIVIHELFFGAYKSQKIIDNIARIDGIQLEILPFESEDARCSGEIRAKLAINGTPIGCYDVLIAGQAVARNLKIITHNTREFQRIDGLEIEDWERC